MVADRGTTNRPPRGVTLIEMVASLVITGILIAATTTTVHIMARTGTQVGAAAERQNAATLAMVRLRNELRLAVAVSEMTNTTVTFVHPDTDSNGLGDVIRYAWSGTAGDPLTRQVDGADALTLLEGVHQFNLAYVLREGDEELPGPSIKSDQRLFMVLTTGAGLTDAEISYAYWLGEYFHPDGFTETRLPSDALSWSVDKISFRARQAGSGDGQTLVQVYRATAGRTPDTSAVLGEAIVQESTLPDPTSYFTYTSVEFGSVTGLSPDEGLCFALTTQDEKPSLETQYHAGPIDLPGAGMLESDDRGAYWKYTATAGLRFSVYGRYTTPGDPVASQNLSGVQISLSIGTEPLIRLDSGVQMLNAPDVTGL